MFAGLLNSLLGASCTKTTERWPPAQFGVLCESVSGVLKQPNPGAKAPPRRRRKAARRRSLTHASRVPTGRRTRNNEYLYILASK